MSEVVLIRDKGYVDRMRKYSVGSISIACAKGVYLVVKLSIERKLPIQPFGFSW